MTREQEAAAVAAEGLRLCSTTREITTMKLRCKNPECVSNTDGDSPCFTVNMTVDEDGDACESARKIEGEYFTCCHCADNAEWVSTDTPNDSGMLRQANTPTD